VTNFGEPNDGMPDMRDPDDIISHGTWHHYRIGLSKCILKHEDKTITRHLCNILNKINI
jgi:hypothetical protein